MWRMNVTAREKLVKTEEKKKALRLLSRISCLLYPLLCFHEYHGVIDLYCLVYFLTANLGSHVWTGRPCEGPVGLLIGQLLQDLAAGVIILITVNGTAHTGC